MKTIFLVHPEELKTAQEIEKILLNLPSYCGILFVGVSVLPDYLPQESRKILHKIVIGCSRSVETDLVRSVAETYLRKQIMNNPKLTIEVYRGSGRPDEFI